MSEPNKFRQAQAAPRAEDKPKTTGGADQQLRAAPKAPPSPKRDEHHEQIRECIRMYKQGKAPEQEGIGWLPSVREVGEWLNLDSPGYVHALLASCPGIERVPTGRGPNQVRWDLERRKVDG